MEEKPDIKRILLLDHDIEALPGKCDLGGFCKVGDNRILHIIREDFKFYLFGAPIHDFGHDFYSSTPELERWILDVTEKGSIDYVVIGNNEGAGIPKAAAVNPDLRTDKACIVWHELFEPTTALREYLTLKDPRLTKYVDKRAEEMKAYAELGYNHFLERRRLAEHLLKHFQWK